MTTKLWLKVEVNESIFIVAGPGNKEPGCPAKDFLIPAINSSVDFEYLSIGWTTSAGKGYNRKHGKSFFDRSQREVRDRQVN